MAPGSRRFYYRQLKPYLDRKFGGLPFVNADEIQRELGPAIGPKDAYRAAEVATEKRVELVRTPE